MRKEAPLKNEVRQFFIKHPSRTFSIHDVTSHFKPNQPVVYHLNWLRAHHFFDPLVRRGYRLNPKWKSPQDIREEVAALPARVQQSTEGWSADKPAIHATINPVAYSILGKDRGESIVARMKALSNIFPEVDIRFIHWLVSDRFPVSEQQRLDWERGLAGAENRAAPRLMAFDLDRENGAPTSCRRAEST